MAFIKMSIPKKINSIKEATCCNKEMKRVRDPIIVDINGGELYTLYYCPICGNTCVYQIAK